METRDVESVEVILDGLDPAAATLESLAQQCHAALSAQIWSTCCWADRMGDGWKIGDFNFLIVSADADAERCQYVQFWSEPGERVVMEISSGEWCPGAIKFMTAAKRRCLAERGFQIGGRARNFVKSVAIDSPTAAEEVAREMLCVFFEVFDYRGRSPLEARRYQGERALHDAVYTSVTPEDFLKLAATAGFEANAEPDGVLAMRHRRRPFVAVLGRQGARDNLYALITYRARLGRPHSMRATSVAKFNRRARLVRIVDIDGELFIEMAVFLDGGVTAQWILNSLDEWMKNWRGCEAQLRRSKRRHRRVRRVVRS